MKNYILPLLFGLQAIILILCLTGFTLLKDELLNQISAPQETSQHATSPEKGGSGIVFEDEQLAISWRNGKQIFESNCTTCHTLNRQSIGPKLGDLCGKYNASDKDWLKRWISNSPRMIFDDKDPRAIALWEANNKAAMNAFPGFSDQQLDDILFYLSPECFGN
ncbi:MAG: cytochrome c [Bacteroidia bacterium]|nr:cytochrome c [Bacteroidia bacterium]